jgi:hypothetical protein
MGLAVISVASGGLPVVEAGSGLAVTEVTNYGLAVTKVVGRPGLPVTFVNADGGPVVPLFATFDPATVSAGDVTLSNGNLTVTHVTGTANVGVRGISANGKYYFEITHVAGIAGDAIGLVTTTGTYGNVLAGTNCTVVFTTSGNISSNNGASGKNIGTLTPSSTVMGLAVDLTARKAWFRKGAAGNWNGLAIGSENPATGLGGVTVAPTVSFMPVVAFGASSGGDVYTANFGASAFTGAVPAGFNNWPAS